MGIADDLFKIYQHTCLAVLAESLQESHRLGAGKWGITVVAPDHIRLVMGSLVVASLEQGCTWFAMPDEPNEKLDRLWNWRWTTSRWHYKNPPSRTGYYWPMKNHEQVWPIIRQAHFAYLAQVAEVYRCLRKPSREAHSNEFLAALEGVLGKALPRPKYE